MKLSQKLVLPAVGIVVLSTGTVLASGLASAASTAHTDGLAHQIATTFHLNEADVQKVIARHRDEQRTQRYDRTKARLDAAVAAGKLTSTQETTILGFFSTRQADMALTGTARKSALKDLRQQEKSFLQANPALKQYVKVQHS